MEVRDRSIINSVFICLVDTFSFEIGMGESRTTASGVLKVGDSNDVVIEIQSHAGRPYNIELLGFSTNSAIETQLELSEIIQINKSKTDLRLDRFVIDTYSRGKN